MQTKPRNFVTESVAAAPSDAVRHYASRFHFETDCWDTHAALAIDERGFVLLDVRSEAAFSAGHIETAIHRPTHTITADWLETFPPETLFVTYCAGPHCNGSTRAALRIAKLGHPVKEMIGGVTGWLDEGFSLVKS